MCEGEKDLLIRQNIDNLRAKAYQERIQSISSKNNLCLYSDMNLNSDLPIVGQNCISCFREDYSSCELYQSKQDSELAKKIRNVENLTMISLRMKDSLKGELIDESILLK